MIPGPDEISGRPPGPLPRGPHTLGHDAVIASQRRRLLDAMAHSIATSGLSTTSVADVVRLAGVSRKTFYELFANKQDCYRATVDHAASVLEHAMATQPADTGTLARRLDDHYSNLCATLASMPDYTRAFVTATAEPDPYVQACQARWRSRATTWLTETYLATSPAATSPAALHPAVSRAVVGATDVLIIEHITTHGPDGLLDVAPTLADIASALLRARIRGHRQASP